MNVEGKLLKGIKGSNVSGRKIKVPEYGENLLIMQCTLV